MLQFHKIPNKRTTEYAIFDGPLIVGQILKVETSRGKRGYCWDVSVTRSNDPYPIGCDAETLYAAKVWAQSMRHA